MGAGASSTPETFQPRRLTTNQASSNDSESHESRRGQNAYHWCHQCEARVSVTGEGVCSRCSGGFVEQLSVTSDMLAGNRFVTAFAAHLSQSMGLDDHDTSSRGAGRATNVSQQVRMEELLRDLQTHLQMAEDIRSVMRAAMAAERPPVMSFVDPASPSVWRMIKKLNEEEITKFIASSDDQCVICCAEYSESSADQRFCELPVCKHVFHEACLEQWLSRASNCPICRNDLKAAAQAIEDEETTSKSTSNVDCLEDSASA